MRISALALTALTMLVPATGSSFQPAILPPVRSSAGIGWTPAQGQLIRVYYKAPSVNMGDVAKGSTAVWQPFNVYAVGYYVNLDANALVLARVDGYSIGKPAYHDTYVIPFSLIVYADPLMVTSPIPATTVAVPNAVSPAPAVITPAPK